MPKRYSNRVLRPTGEEPAEFIDFLPNYGQGDSRERDMTIVDARAATKRSVRVGRSGDERIAVSASTDVGREAWVLTWNVPLEAGGALFDRLVRIELDIEAVPPQA